MNPTAQIEVFDKLRRYLKPRCKPQVPLSLRDEARIRLHSEPDCPVARAVFAADGTTDTQWQRLKAAAALIPPGAP
jgi:hypothetical protein